MSSIWTVVLRYAHPVLSWGRGRAMPTLFVALCAAGCTEEQGPEPLSAAGLEVSIAHDSALAIAQFSLAARGASGQELMAEHRFAPAVSLEPAGLRTDHYHAAIDPALAPQLVTVNVRGLDAVGAVVAAGQAQGLLVADQPTRLMVRMLLPGVCGDGVLARGAEDCDDGNTNPGDGCDASCRREVDPCVVDPPSCAPPPARVHQAAALEEFSTDSPIFVAVPGARLELDVPTSGQSWLVFVSGLLRSSSTEEESVELRLLVDGAEVDLFGHQTLGTGPELFAGFLSFARVTGEGQHVVQAELRAAVGTSFVRGLRMAAAWVPPGADLQISETLAPEERTGDETLLNELAFTPASRGSYLVMGKVSQREHPNFNTVQTYLEDHLGKPHPSDANGATFSNGRDPWQPMFTAFVADLGVEPVSFRLRGIPSSAPARGWWDQGWAGRLPIEVQVQGAVPAGLPVRVDLDHAALVAAGRARADGADLRVVRSTEQGDVEVLPFVLDDDASWGSPQTTLWFNAGAPSPNVAVSYHLYTGNAGARGPGYTPGEVFTLHDTFDAPLDPMRWTLLGNSGTPSGGSLILGSGGSLRSVASFPATSGLVLEARLSLFPAVPAGVAYLGYGGPFFTGGQDPTYLGWYATAEGHFAGQYPAAIQVSPQSPDQSHVFQVHTRTDGTTDFLQDGQSLATSGPQPLPPSEQTIGLGSMARETQTTYEWIRVRLALDTPPLVRLGAFEPRPEPASQWRARRLLAVRTDAWAEVHSAATPELKETTETAVGLLAELRVPAPAAPSEELVLETVRVHGPASVDVRRSGVVQENGRTLLESRHRIDKDGSAGNGYHHNAAVVQARTATQAAVLGVGVRSPDAGLVGGADAFLLVLRYPPAP